MNKPAIITNNTEAVAEVEFSRPPNEDRRPSFAAVIIIRTTNISEPWEERIKLKKYLAKHSLEKALKSIVTNCQVNRYNQVVSYDHLPGFTYRLNSANGSVIFEHAISDEHRVPVIRAALERIGVKFIPPRT